MSKNDNVYRSRKKMLFDNFLGGIVWSIGVWVGTTIIITVFISTFARISLVPAVGDFVTEVNKYIQQTNASFQFK